MPIVDAATLTYTGLRALDMARTVCFWPVSALEVHGPHLPLGMDLYLARWMAEEAGRRFAGAHPDWTVVQVPALPLGTDELPLAGSMNASPRTLYRAVLAHGRSLATAGYRYIVVTNGHGGPRHAAALEAACRWISRRHGVHMFTPSILVLHRIVTGQRFGEVERALGRPLTPEERAGLLAGEHAGTLETSFMLAERPELVDAGWKGLRTLRPPVCGPIARLGPVLERWGRRFGREMAAARLTVEGLASGIGWMLNARYGYGGPVVTYAGDPSVASPALGAAVREVMAADCLEIVEAVTARRMRAADVRSVASDPLVIQPRFWPAVAAGAAGLAALLVL